MLMDIIQRTLISCQAPWAYAAATRIVVLSWALLQLSHSISYISPKGSFFCYTFKIQYTVILYWIISPTSLVQFWFFFLSLLSSYIKSSPVLLFFLTCLPFFLHFSLCYLYSSLVSNLLFLLAPIPAFSSFLFPAVHWWSKQAQQGITVCHRKAAYRVLEVHTHALETKWYFWVVPVPCLCKSKSPMQ